MPKLHIIQGPLEEGAFPIDTEAVTVGRLKRCGIYLPHSTISREHARIHFDGTSHVVKDLGSANGTYLNGAKVSESRVRDGDRLRFGDIELEFHCELDGAKAPPQVPPPKSSFGDVEEIELSDGDATLPSQPRPTQPKQVRKLTETQRSTQRTVRTAPSNTPTKSRGLLHQDIDQQPALRRALTYGAVLLITGAIGWGLFRLMSSSTQSEQPDDGWELIDDSKGG